MFDFQFAGYLLLSKDSKESWNDLNGKKVEACNLVPQTPVGEKVPTEISVVEICMKSETSMAHIHEKSQIRTFFLIYFIQNITQNNMRVFIPIRSSKLQTPGCVQISSRGWWERRKLLGIWICWVDVPWKMAEKTWKQRCMKKTNRFWWLTLAPGSCLGSEYDFQFHRYHMQARWLTLKLSRVMKQSKPFRMQERLKELI